MATVIPPINIPPDPSTMMPGGGGPGLGPGGVVPPPMAPEPMGDPANMPFAGSGVSRQARRLYVGNIPFGLAEVRSMILTIFTL